MALDFTCSNSYQQQSGGNTWQQITQQPRKWSAKYSSPMVRSKQSTAPAWSGYLLRTVKFLPVKRLLPAVMARSLLSLPAVTITSILANSAVSLSTVMSTAKSIPILHAEMQRRSVRRLPKASTTRQQRPKALQPVPAASPLAMAEADKSLILPLMAWR